MFEKFANASGIIFDCDGCLLDSMKTWREVEFGLIKQTNHEWTQDELEEMRAAPMSETAKIFHERWGLLESNEAVSQYMHDTMWDYYNNRATFRQGAREFFEKLQTAGVPCCVVSSTPTKYLNAGLAHVGILDELVAVFSTEETHLSKQDPRLFRLALDELRAEPQTAWGFDDSLYAIRVMNGVGINTVGTYEEDHAGTYEQLCEYATLAIRSFDELLG